MTAPLDDAALARLALHHAAHNRDHALLVTDGGGTIVGAMGATASVLGVEPGALQGRPLHAIFTPHDRERGQLESEIAAALALGSSEDDRWHLRGDGSAVWVTGTLTVLRDPDGSVLGFAKLLRDRTDLRTQIETLENRVEGLRHKLEAEERMLQTIGHELRNCLAPLATATEVVQRAGAAQAADAQDAAATILKRQLAVLGRLADDLMEVARTTSGQLVLQRSHFDLRDLAAAVVQGVAPLAEARGVALLSLLSPLPVRVHADRERLHRLLANLLDNALKHTPAGGRVSARVSEEAPHAVLRVEDDGDGIPHELLPHLFRLFTRGGHGVPGLGVGLALAKEIVEQHDGSIEARSAGAGLGAEFAVRLPLAPGGG